MSRQLIQLALVLFIGLTPGITRNVHAQDDCSVLVQPRLGTGVTARVAFNDGIGIVFRDAPGTTEGESNVFDNLSEGVIFTVIGAEPVCRDGFLWWGVRMPDGREGFIAEGAGRSGGYFVEPWEVGADIFLPDPANPNQISHYFVDSAGRVQTRLPFAIAPQIGFARDVWQSHELALADQTLADRRANCPTQLSGDLSAMNQIGDYPFDPVPHEFFPSPDGMKLLVLRHYLVSLPDCVGTGAQQYGTSMVSIIAANGEQLVFPYSQHSDPPVSQHCQPQADTHLDYPTYINETAWSQDGRYVALGVRYLRSSEFFPCAFYHIFIINTETMETTYAGEGRRLGWGQGGRRLRYVRLERSDPNEAGTQRLISVLPDGSDPIEIFTPGGATWLPGAMDINSTHLPWTENGDKILICNGSVYNCGETLTFRLVDSGFVGPPIIAPEGTQLGSTLQSVHFVAGDTQLLWLSSEGRLFLQPISGENAGRWTEAALELVNDAPITEVIPLQTGIGAVLRLTDGRYFYFDVLANTVKAIEGLPG